MRQHTLIEDIASTIDAYHNCVKSGNALWEGKHLERLEQIARNELPSGSGIDSGTAIDIERSSGNKIILTAGFHHMDENGYYDGWTEHEVIVTPAFDGINLKITGRNRNEIKDYLHDVYYWTLLQVRGEDGSYYDPMSARHTFVKSGECI